MFDRISSLFLTVALLTFLLAGCGGAEAESADSPAASVTLAPIGNQMAFEQTSFTVTAGKTVTLTFDNTATSPAMAHNVVLLANNAETTITRVGQAAIAASDQAYVPEDDAILAATDLAKPGETVTLSFTAPSEPGEYAYICTFPGHYAMMQGVMRVAE